MTKKAAPTTTVDFEQAINELNTIVEKMEHGELTLEQSLSYYERGIALTQQCQKALQAAEQRIQILKSKNNATSLENFDTKTLEQNDDDNE